MSKTTAVEALLSTGFFERVYTHDDLTASAAQHRSVSRVVQESLLCAAQPASECAAQAGFYVNSAVGGTGHGTAYDADRHVPVIFMGRDIKPGRYTQDSAPEDIAPTLAQMLRLEFPREHDSRVLSEMLPR